MAFLHLRDSVTVLVPLLEAFYAGEIKRFNPAATSGSKRLLFTV